MPRIKLTQNKYAEVSAQDVEMLSQYTWHASKTGGSWYARVSSRTPKISNAQMGNILLQPPQGRYVDHINGNPLDNRRENLRIVTPTQNAWNRKAKNTGSTKYKGVWRVKRSYGVAYETSICVEGKRTRLGAFSTAEEAHMAYEEAAKRLQGDYRRRVEE